MKDAEVAETGEGSHTAAGVPQEEARAAPRPNKQTLTTTTTAPRPTPAPTDKRHVQPPLQSMSPVIPTPVLPDSVTEEQVKRRPLPLAMC